MSILGLSQPSTLEKAFIKHAMYCMLKVGEFSFSTQYNDLDAEGNQLSEEGVKKKQERIDKVDNQYKPPTEQTSNPLRNKKVPTQKFIGNGAGFSVGNKASSQYDY